MSTKTTNNLRRYQVFFLALGVFCVIAIATNLIVRRVPVHDATIEDDFSSISNTIDAYASTHGVLPANLGQLDGLSSATQKRLDDYSYTPSNFGAYQLCGTFLGVGRGNDTKRYAQPGGMADTSRHGKGRECFSYQATSNGPVMQPQTIR